MRLAPLAVAWGMALGCGPAPVRVVLQALDLEHCARYCVTRVEVTLAGSSLGKLACAEQLEVGELEVGSTAELVIEASGRGATLVGRALVTAQEDGSSPVEIELSPDRRPEISAVVPAKTLVFDYTNVTVQGTGFGLEADGEVRVGDVPALISEWTPERVVLRTLSAGELVLTSCGVSSAPASTATVEPEVSAHPLPCPAGQLVAADSSTTGRASTQGLVDCRAGGACGRAVVLDLAELEQGTMGQEVVGNAGSASPTCLVDLALGDGAEPPFLASAGEVYDCRLDPSPLMCRARPGSPRGIQQMTLRDGRVGLVVEGGGLWVSTVGGAMPVTLSAGARVLAIDRGFLVETSADGLSRLHIWSAATRTVGAGVLLPQCTTPLGMHVARTANNSVRRVLIACRGDGAELQLLYYEHTNQLGQPMLVQQVPIFGVGKVDAINAAVGLDFALLWDWDGTLVLVNLLNREVRARPWPVTYPGAALGRAREENTFYFGGPEPGQATVMRLEPE